MISFPKIDPSDRTGLVVRENLGHIEMVVVAAKLLLQEPAQRHAIRLLERYAQWELPMPELLLAAHNHEEHEVAAKIRRELSQCGVERIRIVGVQAHNEHMGRAIEMYRESHPEVDAATAKRHILNLAHRGGDGKSLFVEPFTGGQGTTCGEWTPVVFQKPDGTLIKGFLKAGVVTGYCPVCCPFCYLQSRYMDGMNVYLNWEDLATELLRDWRCYPYPINFSEVGGFVEFDDWFADPDGGGSMVQYAIDACAAAEVVPFLLTKIRYPRYLKFNGHVQVGISLMPEALRRQQAPYGSPSDELLESLAWAASAGARDPVIRLFMMRQQLELYPPLLEQCRNLLGRSGWRLTLDIPRFTPVTLMTIARRHPEQEETYARELDPSGTQTLRQLALAGRKAHEKKVRPPEERQAEIYRWVREALNKIGCSDVLVTPCKGDPEELLPLVREGVISAMPCACHKVSERNGGPELVQLTMPVAVPAGNPDLAERGLDTSQTPKHGAP